MQEFKRTARGSRYERRPLVEEFKREMNRAVMSIRTLTIFFSFLLFYFIFSDFTFLYFMGKTMKKACDKEVT